MIKLVDDGEARSVEYPYVKGSFFECRGGWVREGANDDSTMIVMHKA